MRKRKYFVLPSFIPSLTLFLLWGSSKFLPILFFLLFEEFLCFWQVCWQTKFSSIFIYLRVCLLHFWRLILQIQNSGLVILFLQYFKYFIPLFSWLHGFWREVQHDSNCCSSIAKVFLSPLCFLSKLFLCLWFSDIGRGLISSGVWLLLYCVIC